MAGALIQIWYITHYGTQVKLYQLNFHFSLFSHFSFFLLTFFAISNLSPPRGWLASILSTSQRHFWSLWTPLWYINACDTSTSFQVLVWGRLASCHYIKRCRPRFMTPHDVTTGLFMTKQYFNTTSVSGCRYIRSHFPILSWPISIMLYTISCMKHITNFPKPCALFQSKDITVRGCQQETSNKT